MARVINSSRMDFADEVSKMMMSYSQDVYEVTLEAIDEVSKEAVKKLRAASPKGATKKYSKGWTRNLDKGRLKAGAVIYGNKNTYPLAHLLEYGHAKRGGGRVKEITHIKPVADWASDEVYDLIIDKLSKGVGL